MAQNPRPILPLSEIPQTLRPIAHFVKIANEYASRDVVIYYWCLLKAVEEGMNLDGSSPDTKKYIINLMDILEKVKQQNRDKEALTQDICAQSHIEDQAQRLFQYANSQDQQAQFNQKVVKSFYTCSYLFDVLSIFGQLDENIQSARKYARWRSTYIHNCLKKGEQPIPGNQMVHTDDNPQPPVREEDIASEINDALSAELNALNASFGAPQQNKQQFPHQYTIGNGTQQIMPPNVPTYVPPAQQFGGGVYPNVYDMGANPRPGLQTPYSPPPSQFQHHQPQPHQPPQRPEPSYLSTGGGRSPLPVIPTSEKTKPMVSPSATAMKESAAQGLKLDDYLEAKKYTKYAASALDYEDPNTAIDYLQKAIAVLQKRGIN